MESYNVHNNVTPLSGNISAGQASFARSDEANAFARDIHRVSTGNYLSSGSELPALTDNVTDNRQQLRMRAVVTAAMTEVGKNKPTHKSVKGLIDHERFSGRKGMNESGVFGKWHECNKPKRNARCPSFKFHMYKGVS